MTGLEGAAEPGMRVSAHVAGHMVSAVTDAAGRYRLAPVAPGRIVMRVASPLDWDQAMERVVDVVPGGEQRVDFDLRPAFGWFLGLALRDGHAAGLHPLTFHATWVGEEVRIRTGSDGRFRSPPLPPGAYWVALVRPPERGWSETPLVTRAAVLQAGEVMHLDLALQSARLEVEVQDPSGMPATAYVGLYTRAPADAEEPWWCRRGFHVQGEGPVRIDDLEPGRWLLAVSPVRPDALAVSRRVVDLVAGETRRVVVRRSAPGAFRVRLRAPPNRTLEEVLGVDDVTRAELTVREIRADGTTREEQAELMAGGELVMDDVEPGRLTIEVEQLVEEDAGNVRWLGRAEVEVVAGQTVETSLDVGRE